MDIAARKLRLWKHRSGDFRLGERTLLMGIVNITPNSFSDGGKFLAPEKAVEYALALQEQGADLLDLGAESTRPGSEDVSAREQLHRLLPVLERLHDKIQVPLSVDTRSAEVAEACLQAGISIINDISGFHHDAALPALCARFNAGVVLMHMRGTPHTMQQDTHYDDLFGEIHAFLAEGVATAERAGVERERILVDPGIGFGKSFEQNYLLLGGLQRFRDLAAGVLAGPSRKRFMGEFCGLPADKRQFPTAAATALAILHGADVVRVHDVAEMRQVADIVDRFRELHESRI
jgi:dihydropteroate synthase